MTFPVIAASAITTLAWPGSGNPQPVNLPQGIVSGDLLVVAVTPRGAGIPTWPAGWTRFTNPDSSTPAMAVAWKIADGTEGATVNVTASFVNISAVALRITGHDAGSPIFASSYVAGLGTDELVDPASLTPAGGAKDYLWLEVGGHEAQTIERWISAVVSANYTEVARSDFTGNFPRTIIGKRELNAASEDPGTMNFNSGAADDGFAKRALTLAIAPAGGLDLVKMRAESAGIPEGAVRALGMARARAEAVGPIETVRRALGLARIRSEISSLDETLVRARALARIRAETAGLADAAMRALGLVRTKTETVSLNALLAHARTLIKQHAETEAAGENSRAARAMSRAAASVVDAGEGLTKTLTMVRARGEIEGLGETILGRLASALIKIVAETAGILESRLVSRRLTRRLDETLAALEAAARALALVRRSGESQGLGETAQKIMALNRAAFETERAAEGLVRTRNLVRLRNALVGLTETLIRAVTASAAPALIRGAVVLRAALGGVVAPRKRHSGTIDVNKD